MGYAQNLAQRFINALEDAESMIKNQSSANALYTGIVLGFALGNKGISPSMQKIVDDIVTSSEVAKRLNIK